MRVSRLFLPLFLAFALLTAQQGAAAHALTHVFAQGGHQDKHAPHSSACEQCAAYAQLGSALHVSPFDLTLPAAPTGGVAHIPSSFRSIQVLAATARAPPLPA